LRPRQADHADRDGHDQSARDQDPCRWPSRTHSHILPVAGRVGRAPVRYGRGERR
jgi:hypothetical protein